MRQTSGDIPLERTETSGHVTNYELSTMAIRAHWKNDRGDSIRAASTFRSRNIAGLVAMVLMATIQVRVWAQSAEPSNQADAAFNGAPVPVPTPISEVPKGDRIPIASANFDQGGYIVTEQSGATIDVPFANQNLDVLRFGRSTTGAAYLVSEAEGPVLYVPNHFFLVSAAGAEVKWQPLPDTYVETRPIFVSIAPSWEEFLHLDFYAGMTWYGGVWGYRRGFLEAMPHRLVQFDGRPYTYEAYRRYAYAHPGQRIGRSNVRDVRARSASLDHTLHSPDRLSGPDRRSESGRQAENSTNLHNLRQGTVTAGHPVTGERIGINTQPATKSNTSSTIGPLGHSGSATAMTTKPASTAVGVRSTMSPSHISNPPTRSVGTSTSSLSHSASPTISGSSSVGSKTKTSAVGTSTSTASKSTTHSITGSASTATKSTPSDKSK